MDFKHPVHIQLFDKGFLVTAGVMSLCYFMHNCVVIVLKSNKEEHNVRDLALGYLAVGISYLLIGFLGYFGFSGNGFPQDGIAQNALDMFQPTNPFAFAIRCVLFIQMATVYPMMAYLVRSQLFTFVYNTDFPSRKAVLLFSLAISALTTLVTMFFPNIGSIMSIFGAICGLYFIYLTPVLLQMYLGRGTSVAPQESEALILQGKASLQSSALSKLLHSLIPLLGLVIAVFQFVPLTLL